MSFKRILAEDLPKDPIKEDYPDEAYGYVDKEFRLLRHHNKNVADGMECDSIDEELLGLSISIAENVIQFGEETKQNIIEHLQMHVEQLKGKKCTKKNTSKKSKVTDATLLDIINKKFPDIKSASAAITSVKTSGQSIIYQIILEDDSDDGQMEDGPIAQWSVTIEVTYDGAGKLSSVRIFDSIISPEVAGDLLNFISNLPNLS